MMPTLAPARPSSIEAAAIPPVPPSGPGWRPAGRRGARLLLAAACVMPLGACAAQPAVQSPQESTTAAQTPARPAPPQAAPEQTQSRQNGTAAAPATASATAPATAPATAAPDTPAARPARPQDTPSVRTPASTSSPSASASGNAGARASTPVAERATTVGEVPTTAGPVTSAPGTASMPGAPAAIPGTPANPAPMPQAGTPGATPGPSAGTLAQTVLALLLVLALLGALAWGMKRFGPRMAGSNANLRMVGALNIGGRERIMVVEVAGQWIVVGASPGRVNALATMPKPGPDENGAQGAAGGASLAGHAPPAASFSDWLKQTIDKRNAK